MSLELAIVIGGYLAEWGTVKLADRLLSGVGSKLHTQELDKALKAGITAAHEREKTLFYPCPPHLIPAGFFEYWLDDGRALILLDGLDEIAESGKRDEIIRKIECFLGQFDKNRAIITSRPAGYKPVFFRTQELPHYTLQLFDESKIELFVKSWYKSRFKDLEEAQRRQESLKKALTGQERIKVLAKNPLLLTIISLIHRYEADLPRQRYKLYDRAVKTLLTAWDAGKGLDYQLPLDYLNRDDIERLMQRLAYWIHTQGGTGDKQGGTLIDKGELIRQLRKESSLSNKKELSDIKQRQKPNALSGIFESVAVY